MSMRWLLLLPVMLLIGIGGPMTLTACAARCYATPDKLAHLRRDMTYAEVIDVMGCAGRPLSRRGPESSAYSTVEWDGPDQIFFQSTQLDFLGDRLLSYTVARRGAL